MAARQALSSASAGATVAILMGVSGSGKTTVGKRLAAVLGASFHDGDDYHSRESVEKMSRGLPLGDEDRKPWLARLRRVACDALDQERSAVIACSALKRSYRRYLGWGRRSVRFVYLRGSPRLLHERLAARQGHYMKAGMLDSQLAALEEPGAEALTIDAGLATDEIVARIRGALARGGR